MNIWQIQQELLSIFDELEENGGELTEELEQQLTITQENFNNKIKDYTNAIKMLNSEIQSIKVEQKRLKDLSDKKQKVIDKLTNIIIKAIEEFGNTRKSGVKYINYGNGEVSIRNSKSVDVNTDILTEIGKAVALTAQYANDTNQLDVADRLNMNDIIQFVNLKTKDDNDNIIEGYTVNEDDLRHTNIELSIKVPLSELIDGKAYAIIKEIARHTNCFESIASVSKSELKKELETNGSCAPNLAKLVINKNIHYV